MQWRDIEWEGCHTPVSEEVIDRAQRLFGVVLPPDYRDCLRVCHGGRPAKNAFAFEDPDVGRMESCIGVLLSYSDDDPESIFAAFESLKPSLPEGVVPISDDGGGDFVCLDFSRGSPPRVGYWHHGEDSLVPLAPTFSAFIGMLYGASAEFKPRGYVSAGN